MLDLVRGCELDVVVAWTRPAHPPPTELGYLMKLLGSITRRAGSPPLISEWSLGEADT